MQIHDDAARDAVALVAALRRGNMDAYELLTGMYRGNTVAQDILCGALAALSTAILSTYDSLANRLLTEDGYSIPDSDAVLSSVMLRLAKPA
jgi:hypothetical protein